MLDSLLDRLARQCGIGDAYLSYRGEPMRISQASREAILSAMGRPTGDVAKIERVLVEIESEKWFAPLPPVAVVHPGSAGVTIAAASDALDRPLHWQVVLENGGVLRGSVRTCELAERESIQLGAERRTRRILVLPEDLPHGYHSLRVVVEGGTGAECALIAAPLTSFEPQVLRDGQRLWGVAVQIYTLRSDHNWGIGDFADLADVARRCAPAGASFIGLNPLHALFPCNPWHFSPYSPSSRYFLHVLYIAVERVAEYAACVEAQGMVATPEFQEELARLRATELVDYPGVARTKMPVLRALYEHFRREHVSRGSSRAAVFRAYLAERGEPLRLHALHDAIDEHLRARGNDRYWGWPVWPEGLRDPGHAGAREFEIAHIEAVEYYAWLQWVADEQLGSAQQLALELGMKIGLYGDYAVGVNPSGSETWSDQSLYRKGAGVGAPPDALALKGQDWGIPPQDPNVLAMEQYAPFRNLIAANMRHFGALRLDHVMALYRQWWVPVGLGANEGGYVQYPHDDLMSLLALESERHCCLAIGEDLGTVPPEMSLAMAERAVYSYRVLLFEKHADGRFLRPDEYPRRAIATVTTHDLPTLAGYWSGSDIALRQRLALYPSADVRAQVENERDRDRAALLTALDAAGLEPADGEITGCPYDESLSRAVHVYLAGSSAALVALQAEDLVGMQDPVNVPGTSDEHLNWQRKMSCSVEAIFASEPVQRTLRCVHAARIG